MSGGSFDYGYLKLQEYVGHTEDEDLDKMLKDLSKLLHDLEWYSSCDYSQDQYLEEKEKFKSRWLK